MQKAERSKKIVIRKRWNTPLVVSSDSVLEYEVRIQFLAHYLHKARRREHFPGQPVHQHIYRAGLENENNGILNEIGNPFTLIIFQQM